MPRYSQTDSALDFHDRDVRCRVGDRPKGAVPGEGRNGLGGLSYVDNGEVVSMNAVMADEDVELDELTERIEALLEV